MKKQELEIDLDDKELDEAQLAEVQGGAASATPTDAGKGIDVDVLEIALSFGEPRH